MITLPEKDQKFIATFKSLTEVEDSELKIVCLHFLDIIDRQSKAIEKIQKHYDDFQGLDFPRGSYFEWLTWQDLKLKAQQILEGHGQGHETND